MIYLVYGEDSFRAWEFIRGLGKRKPVVVNEAGEVDRIFAGLDQVSFFDVPQLVVLRNLLDKVGEEQLWRLRPSSHEVVFWEERRRVDRRSRVVKILLEKAQVKIFSPLNEYAVAEWIRGKIRSKRSEVEDAAIQKLIELHGNNLWFIKNELDKLFAYVRSQGRGVIVAEDVEKLAVSSREESIFAFVDAVGERKMDEALKLFYRLLDQQVTPEHLFAMVVRQFRLLILAKVKALTNEYSFVIQKCTQQAGRWKLETLIQAYHQLAWIDQQVKKGSQDLVTALTLFLTMNLSWF